MCEKRLHAIENFWPRVRAVDGLAKFAAVAHAMREQCGELLHFAHRIGHLRIHQAAKIS